MATALPHQQSGAARASGSGTRTVAALLLRHAEARATGMLTLARGQVRKQLELGTGLLTEERMAELLAEVKQRGRKMGTVLLELGWVGPAQIVEALGEQVRRRAVSCLRWNEHEVTFEPRGLDAAGKAMAHPCELP